MCSPRASLLSYLHIWAWCGTNLQRLPPSFTEIVWNFIKTQLLGCRTTSSLPLLLSYWLRSRCNLGGLRSSLGRVPCHLVFFFFKITLDIISSRSLVFCFLPFLLLLRRWLTILHSHEHISVLIWSCWEALSKQGSMTLSWTLCHQTSRPHQLVCALVGVVFSFITALPRQLLLPTTVWRVKYLLCILSFRVLPWIASELSTHITF